MLKEIKMENERNLRNALAYNLSLYRVVILLKSLRQFCLKKYCNFDRQKGRSFDFLLILLNLCTKVLLVMI